MKLHPKIQELKQRAAPINFNNVSVNQYGALETRDSLLDERVVEGYAVIWGIPNDYGEKFIKGSFANSINQRGPNSNSNYKIKFLYQHDQLDALSLFDEIREDETGLYFRTKPLDDVTNADRVLKQVRSGTLNNFSIGFDFIWDKIEYDDSDDTLIMKEVALFEISIVTIPADMNTFAIRSAEQIENLHDDTEDFIKSLPRKNQLEARNIFARHKALVNVEPLNQDETALNTDEPHEKDGIDYNFLKSNFSLK